MPDAPQARPVGLLIDPDPQALIGLIGILKAGRGFVPVDPRHEDDRTAGMLEDCACELLVTQKRHLPRAVGLARGTAGLRHIICLDGEEEDAGELDGVSIHVLGDLPSATGTDSAADRRGEPLYILDRAGRLALFGVRGELHVGGSGVAWSSLQTPELTAERFVPDPFSEVPGGRLYRTGALARYLAEGDLEILGPIDRQPGDGAGGGREWIATASEGPRTATEARLAEIWTELLRIASPGRGENFFAIGGHSLLAARLITHVRKAFGVELPLRRVFETPTIAALAAQIDAESPAKPPEEPLLPRVQEGVAAPLSFAQERLWFLDRLQPDSALYNIPAALRLTGALDTAALRRSFDEIVRRHGALRTTFDEVDGSPRQTVDAPKALPLPVVDLSGLPEEIREAEAVRQTLAEVGRPFDLARGPLLRLHLFRLDGHDHLLIANVHHIASDGWSMGILVGEATALYQAFAGGLPSPLSELPLQYIDFAARQRRSLTGPALQTRLDFWRRELAGAPALLALPTDRPRPAAQSFRGATAGFTLPAEASVAVRALARQVGATPFMVLLSVFQALLYLWSGMDDVLVGSPVANRDHVEIEGLIGFFINTLVFRRRFGDLEGFRAVLEGVRGTQLAAHAHRDLPFELVVDALGVPRSLAYSPLFQVMLSVQNAPAGELRVPGLTFSPVDLPSTTAKFDLTLSFVEAVDGFSGGTEYAADLFDRATVERFHGHFANLLVSAAADPGRPLTELRLMDAAEERLLLSELNQATRAYALPVTVQELFLQQAKRTPDKPAVIGPEEDMTYRELAERSAGLARLIRRAFRTEPLDRRIALLADPGPQVLLGMLGILESGGAFVPIDPRAPEERLAWLLEDCGCEVLVTQQRHMERVTAVARSLGGLRRILCLDGGDSLTAQPPEPHREPRSLAYIVYTSGSTGRPKGVQVSHESLVPMLRWGCEYLGLGEHSRVLQSLSYFFDFGIFEQLTTVLAGGTLFFPGEEAAGDPVACARVIAQRRINTLHTTPAFARELAAGGETLDSLEIVHLGGEALSRDTVARLREAAPHATVYNGYGPTEATINSAIYRVGPVEDWPTVPIGRRSADNTLYIVSPAGLPVPFGVRGELRVGGIGVARGYLNRPELTAERFVPDPFALIPGGRLYCTGDLVRYLPDGDIEFLGRIDQQVKVRGFRVEPGEIEAALREHPAVREAAVLALPDPSGSLRLVAYVAAGEADTAELRSFLTQRLPAHMVPSAFVALAALPLTPNGKLDRKALPEPERTDTVASEEPRTATEARLAEIWADLLGIAPPGRDENFFEIGGHSLLATRVLSHVRRTFGVDLPLRIMFEAPTIAAFATQVDAARPLEVREETPASRNQAEAPLSFAQERLWFLDRLQPGSALYNIPAVLRLTGDLDVEALRRSFDEIVRRHGALRTTFVEIDGSPRQAVTPPSAVPLPVVDLSGLPGDQREAEAMRRAFEEVRRPFDLAKGPLLRLHLFRLDDSGHILIANVHHIASDGWSMGILVREASALYRSFVLGRPSPLPALPLQYTDFAVRQRRSLTGPALQAQLDFWLRELAGAPALLELPTDRPRPPVQSFRGAGVAFTLPTNAAAAVQSLARQAGATPFMVLLAAFQTLLHRWSGGDDVLVGSPIANRSSVDIEELIGFFINTLVFRLRFGEREGFRAVLDRVRATMLAAHAHQDLPFELVVDALGVPRSLAHNPLFQVMLSLQNAPAGELRAPGLTFSPVDLPSTTAKFDLSLTLVEAEKGFVGGIEYAADLFDRGTIERFLGHFANLLVSAAAEPARPLSELRLMDGAEERLLLADLNRAERIYALPVVVDELFRRQVERAPNKIAVVGPQEEMTYRELADRSATLAALIRKAFAGETIDQRIGLLVDPGPQVPLGMLGILASGAGFVPIDPRSPDERLAWLLEDCACEVLVTQSRHLERVSVLTGDTARLRHILCLDEIDDGGAAVSLQPHRDPRSLAYIVYTSGSTGRPKGVQVSHESLVPMLLWGCEYLSLGEHSRVLQSLSFFFDFGVFEQLTTLLAGGTLCFPGEAAGDPEAFAREIARRDINTLHTTPAFARELVATGEPLDRLEIVHLGGEALARSTVAQIQEAAPHATVYNGYGPTEATINSAIYQIRPSGPIGDWPIVPIGRRSADNALYIVDDAGLLIPFGVRGELVVGGIGVARGYLNRPDLTAERFVPDPFGVTPGGRLYRTGDLVRYLPEGDIEFLGRIDQQVKVRGFRVEPGEIEAALREHPAVHEIAVIARPEPSGDLRLIAYIVPVEEAAVEIPELRAFLAQRLPAHMVPTAFVLLVSLPLTPNGKLDRKALSEPEQINEEAAGAEAAAPRTETEELLAGLWAQLLDRPRIGIFESFFALGGHSLLGARLVSRVRQSLGIELPLRVLFEDPTIAGLAERIDALRRPEIVREPPLLPTGATEAPLSFAQERLWFLDRLEPDSASYNIPAVLRLTGDLDVEALQRSFTEIIRRHSALRTAFAEIDGEPRQVIHPEAPVSLPIVDLAALPEEHRDEETAVLVAQEVGRPFSLAHGPLLRLHLLRSGQHDHILIANVHHIASDGWSMGVLVREATALYQAFVQGLPSPLPELPIQYIDFALWQRRWLSGPVLTEQLDFWRRELADAPALLELPIDRPRPAVQTYRGDALVFSLVAEASQAVRALAQRTATTPFMVLLAAFQSLLHRWSGMDDVLVGSPIANRNRVETEGLIGVFVNTVVFSLRLRGGESFLAALQRVHETTLAGQDHQDLPFELLVDELAIERSLAYTPLFQVMLVLQNAPMGDLKAPGLTFSPVAWPSTTAKFDLTLSLVETADGFAGALEYATDLFERTTVERFLGHFSNLLMSAAANPEQSLADLRLMDAAEERMLLADLNHAEKTYALPVTVPELFVQQVERTPEQLAVAGERGAMTYRQLAARSATLAAQIQLALGGSPLEQRVGLLADAEPPVLLGLLGILQSGGGFVPLDPRSPDERLAWLLEDCACRVLVTQRRHRDRLHAMAPGLRILCLDDIEASGDAPKRYREPRSLAYVVYTSGSTGRPKGVPISHENLVPMLRWGCDYLGLGEHSRVLQSLSYFFDFGIFEQLTTVLAGGTLFFPGEAAGDPAAFTREIVRLRINTLHTTPAFARELAAGEEKLDSLEIVHLGGEALARSTVARIQEIAPRATVYNGYGPTEATVNSAIYETGSDNVWPVVPIGRRSADNALYILDSAGRLVPFGVRGELLVGGIGVARGYLNRPDLTAERFVPDPFGSEPGGRLYRTGDLVRYLPGGDIEFLGRIDQQVKVRGFRIEPGEIEAALREHPAVREAVVIARPEPSGNLRLIAYVVAAGVETAELRAFLAQSLPAHMVPAAFVALDALPLTPNGKLDRKALPEPERTGEEVAVAAAPRTPTEELVASLWSKLLEIPRVGVFDNFFALGGHSLLGARLVSRLRRSLGIELPLRALFEEPTVAGLAERIDALQGGRTIEPPLLPTGATEAPLSFAQERLWFLDRLEPDSASYNIPAVLRLTGDLDVGTLQRCFREIVRRHGALRTTFTEIDGAPRQVVSPDVSISLPMIDLAGLPPSDRDREAAHRIAQEVGRSFDLAQGPLLRLHLLRNGVHDHILIANFHHIASDGWSIGVLVREATTLYQAFVQGLSSPLPELPIQYVDFALWQRRWLAGAVLARQLDFWRGQLSGAPALLELPTDRPRPAVQTYRGSTLGIALRADASAAVHTLAQRQGATPFMVLLAAFQTLLHRWSGADDVLVGSPIANRGRVETEGLIGIFVNTVVFPLRLQGGESFLAALDRVRTTTLAGQDHQDLPFELLVDALGVERSLAHSPLFQAMLVLQNAPTGDLQIPGLTFSPVDWPSTTAKFDLTLSLIETPDGLAGALEYATDLFDRATMERFVGHFANLLVHAAENPEQSLAELRLMGEAEEQLLQVDLNRAEQIYALPTIVPDLFAQQVERTPEKLAVVGVREALTYRELAERSTALAGQLQKAGVRIDQRVGLLADPEPSVLLGMLGILQSGGGFVPLDPRSPDERLAWLLEDCDCQVLVTQRRHLERVSAIAPSLQILCLEEIKGSGEAPEPHREPRSLAYIVYTSGSTGRPKGVPISHENLVPMLRWGCDYLGLGEHSRVLQSLSYFFDFGIFEQLTTMLAGGTLFFPGEAAGDPAAFAREIVRRGVNTLHTTPAFARELAASDLSLDSLEIVHLGGEALARSTVARIQEAAPHATVYNGYGPTEATVNSAIYEIGPLTENSWPVMPIGRRSADNALYILDSAGRLVPFSVRGELLVGGIGVARGYLNRPDLTAERFVPDPFGSEPGGRLYRTGDLVRYLPSGDIEFLGRIDQQVKVRGFRIEPGEIEAALREHPAVRETVVIARPEPSGNLRLIAYVVASGMDSAELRAFLAQRLPAHMVPSAFVALAALPLTPNGKLDRKALPEPEQAEAAEPQAGTAPRTPEEEMLAGLWAQLLGLSSVGVDDNFFALGGHSLLAARLVARIREALEIDLPLRALFEAPTVAGLAARLATARRAEAIPPLVPRERSGEVPLSFAQERLWIVDQLSPGNAAYNMPLAVRLDGRLDAAALAQSFAKIVRRHETLRTTFQTVAGRPVQVIAPEAGFVLPRIDLVGLPEEKRAAEAQRLLAVEAVRPFDLAQGPILRVLLLRLSEQEHLCLVNMHHIASDGWSLGVLVREVGALYTSFAEGLASPLPPLPVQYADFTLWQREWLQGEVLERQIDFWRNTLAGAPTRLELPTDRPRPAVASLAGAAVPVALSADLTASLSALAQRRGATLFMTLLAAFDALLHRITSQEDLLVGSPVANRGVTQIEGLIGFFVNTLVLRARPTADQPFTALLSEVRSAALAAYAHQDLPFERLVDELAVGRSLDRNPLFQTLLAVQNAPVEALDLPGLTLSPVEAETATAKFDLSLALGTSAQGLAGAIEYATDLFDAATVHRFAGWFARLLAGAVADPEQPLRELPLLTPSELQQTLTAWNDTATAYPREATIHALFAEQAALRPTSVALVGDSAELSYKDLDVAANRLAHHLRALGVGPEVLTAVCLERSLEAVITLLAVLKAGGAFVPLDPTYPADRLAFMLADTAAPVLVTEERLLSRLPIPEGLRVVCLDREDEAIAQRAANDPGVEVSPDGLAYVMYTSGSTGRPKGVAVSHRNVVRLVRETHFADLSASQVFLQLAPLSFDASTLEIWGPLANGGRLAVLPAGQPTLAELGAAIERFGVTTLWLTAGLFHQMAEAEPQSLRRLSQLLAGGDVLQAQAIRRLLAEPGGPVLINGYGPTEGTTFTCCHPMTDPRQVPGSVPIGRPIANTRIFLLDRSATPVPVGVPGELYAAGDGLARGYLNRPELTAEKFVPAPTVCGEAPGARLYRTGDLARFLPDGTVEFMGRIDQQVKIRGFRIEPEEIQAVLSRHPQVREALVIVRAEGDDKRLIGYLIPAGDEVPTSAELRDFLRDQLPEYMIPSAFVALQAWPLTPNSKIDRAALPAPERTGAADRIAPRDVLEHELARLWEDVLGVGPIGIRDDFFALGGHSLLAVRLMAQVEEQLGRSLPLTALFTAGTVEGMAALLREESAPESASNIIPLQPRGTRPPFFWVHPAGGDVLCYAMLSRYLGDDQPLYGIQARGFARDEERPNSLEEMAALYIDEIRLRQPEGPYFLGGWSLGGPVAFEMARQLRALGETVGLLAILDGAPFLETARPEESDVDYLLDIAAYVGNFWGRAPEVSPERLATLDPDGQIAYVAEGLAAVDFLPPGTGERQLRRVLAVYRANVTALRAYQAGFYPDGLTLLRAEERPDAPGLLSRDDLGWRDLTGGPVEILTVPGNHLSLLAEPNVHVLAAHLRACLERAQTTASVPLLQSP